MDLDTTTQNKATLGRAKSFSEGDFVQWNSSGGTARGQIERVVREGSIDVPDSSFTVEGTEDDPAALISVFRKNAEGWDKTDTKVGHRFSALT